MTQQDRRPSDDPALDDAGQPRRPTRPGRGAEAASRSFVLDLAPGVNPDGRFQGRVQHLATLDGGNFTSAEMLVDIVHRVLERVRKDNAGDDDG